MNNKKNFNETNDFKNLQKLWYDKLKDTGFNDIEWIDHKSGRGQNSSYLVNSANSMTRKYNSLHAYSFKLCLNYATNGIFLPKIHRLILKLYCDGLSLRQTKRAMDKAFPSNKRSLFFYCNLLQALRANALIFNQRHSKGLIE